MTWSKAFKLVTATLLVGTVYLMSLWLVAGYSYTVGVQDAIDRMTQPTIDTRH